MNKFVQYIPAYYDRCEPKCFYFHSQEDLVKELSGLGYGNKVGQYFELLDNSIMEVSDDGYYWRFAGNVSSIEGLTFNRWEAKYKPTKKEEQPKQTGGFILYDPKNIVVRVGGVVIEGFSGDFIAIEKESV